MIRFSASWRWVSNGARDRVASASPRSLIIGGQLSQSRLEFCTRTPTRLSSSPSSFHITISRASNTEPWGLGLSDSRRIMTLTAPQQEAFSKALGSRPFTPGSLAIVEINGMPVVELEQLKQLFRSANTSVQLKIDEVGSSAGGATPTPEAAAAATAVPPTTTSPASETITPTAMPNAVNTSPAVAASPPVTTPQQQGLSRPQGSVAAPSGSLPRGGSSSSSSTFASPPLDVQSLVQQAFDALQKITAEGGGYRIVIEIQPLAGGSGKAATISSSSSNVIPGSAAPLKSGSPSSSQEPGRGEQRGGGGAGPVSPSAASAHRGGSQGRAGGGGWLHRAQQQQQQTRSSQNDLSRGGGRSRGAGPSGGPQHKEAAGEPQLEASLASRLEAWLASPDVILELPPQLSSKQRAQVHGWAVKHQCASYSSGQGAARFLTVAKPVATIPEPVV